MPKIEAVRLYASVAKNQARQEFANNLVAFIGQDIRRCLTCDFPVSPPGVVGKCKQYEKGAE